ncbi:tRNA (N6-threonylcarbamoyladenosine(37)-N6)-methyltransferase TrmO [Ferrovibrio sp.]|uniref:tRNA (N6-threonylcarbamoyladenosine(37)-N6)-methyltransferase TrmO n=1 Tax=Ferrovibrio sp. TaxID=1917215 RepID=UPI001B4D737A|nr:tRNA (N6-threonylcarbamoyladenosine(37)-N6)-methyltransferase TrmO [Ferrovibrio sp.]MBP7063758.1 tRNA (N6-threonylcarbamoyladenosine(37)-N6)-methyltransferase TrmO [Ferrovibrio sp.]
MDTTLRPAEIAVELPAASDAGLHFIGRIHTPWATRDLCPRQGKPDGPLCRVEVFAPWLPALDGVEAFAQLEILYWLDRSRRDLVQQSPGRNGQAHGTFSLRSPLRPNPIGLSRVVLERREGNSLLVRGLDCLDGTPLLDIKPDHCRFAAQTTTPAAP